MVFLFLVRAVASKSNHHGAVTIRRGMPNRLSWQAPSRILLHDSDRYVG